MPLLEHPILVISVNENTRNALCESLNAFDVKLVACSTFLEAEDLALKGLFAGILVDLPTIVKTKGEEKIVACSLTGFFPSLRVRIMGNMLIPMTMPGAARQENSLNDFISRACKNFVPRQLRTHHRHNLCVSVITRFLGTETRAFTLNICWGGVFIVDFTPERFSQGDQIQLLFVEPDCEVMATVCWIQPWGLRHAPGIGVKFNEIDEVMAKFLLGILKRSRDHDRDRVVA